MVRGGLYGLPRTAVQEVHMNKLREDLVGVVYINGRAYKAGDALPDGAVVADSLTAREAVEDAPKTRRSRKGG